MVKLKALAMAPASPLNRPPEPQRKPRRADGRVPFYTIIISCIASLLINWAGVWEATQRVEHTITQDSFRELQQTATLFADQVGNAINSVDVTLRFTAHHLASHEESIKALVDKGAISLEHLVLLTFVDKDGNTVESNLGPDPNRTPLADREHIRVHLEGSVDGLFIGKPVIGRVSKLWSIQLTRKVVDADGSLRGVLVASLDPFYFNRFWEGVLKSDDERILQPSVTLYGLDGVVRTGSRNLEAALQAQAPQESLRALAMRMQSGRLSDHSSENAQASYFIRMPNLPLIAVASYLRTGIETKAREQEMELYILGFVISAIIIVTGAILLWSITVSRRNELRAVSAETRLASALDAMKDSFAIYDEEGKLAAFNKSFANWFSKGGAMQDLQRMESFLSQRSIPLALGEQTRENEIQFDDKSWLRIESSQTPVGETVLYGADITQSRLREEALVERTRQVEAQAQRMEELATIAERAAKVKSSFLAAMSHEIRTPLNAINGFTQLLRKNHVDDESNRITALISDSCRHLLDIVDDILDFTRLEADKVTLHLRPITVRNLVSELMQTAQVLTKDKPVTVAYDVETAIPERINADQRRLKQILLNLISNAAKFTQQGSIEVHVKLSGDRILYEVCDTGDGIPPTVGARIFEPFEQASPEGQLRAAGTGLGLAITRRLVNLMGGHISFRNRNGGGTIFCVDLPFSPAADHEIKSTPSSEVLRDIGSLNILIADDAPSSRMLLRLMLSKHGHKVDEAENGLEAVEALQAKAYDLVVLDVQMPVMDGLRAAQTVRTMRNGKSQLPLIALTAQVLDEEVVRAKQAGFDIVLGKPFMEEDLRNAIREALNERKSLA